MEKEDSRPLPDRDRLREIVQYHERGLRALHKQLRGTGYGAVSYAALAAADACYEAFRVLSSPPPAPPGPGRADTLSA